MQQPQAKLKQIKRILALWPSQAGDDGDELLRAYLLAVDDYPADDVERAVDMLVKGTAPGVSPSYRPKPSETGAECRRQMNLRLEHEAREKAFRPKLPPPDNVKTPESRAKFKAIVDGIVANLALPEDEDPTERHRARLRRTNAVVDAQRFDVGDPEGQEDAA